MWFQITCRLHFLTILIRRGVCGRARTRRTAKKTLRYRCDTRVAWWYARKIEKKNRSKRRRKWERKKKEKPFKRPTRHTGGKRTTRGAHAAMLLLLLLPILLLKLNNITKHTMRNAHRLLQQLYTGTRARDTRTFADCCASSHVSAVVLLARLPPNY